METTMCHSFLKGFWMPHKAVALNLGLEKALIWKTCELEGTNNGPFGLLSLKHQEAL